MRRILIAAGVLAIGYLAGGMPGVAEEAKPIDLASAPAGDGNTLMGMLGPWAYPGATWVEGAEMADGGNPKLQSVKCKTVLVTPDSFEDVTKYYAEKLNIDKKGNDAVKKPQLGGDGGRSVTVINDSVFDEGDERPVKLQVITVNKPESSTTLVISRAAEERETHIAWSHFKRVGGEK
ncbi:hypothetical protein [Lacipirellula sp.]|uniref:hypothetical protein n=1 Tax=Lacipirellula sp. TaxID=2691419 RepID=UPI003D14F442